MSRYYREWCRSGVVISPLIISFAYNIIWGLHPNSFMGVMMNLFELVSHSARLHPDKPALVDDDGRSITFKELCNRSFQLAAAIRRLCNPGDRVGICLNSRLEWAEIFWACALSETVAVPLNHRLPESDLILMLEDANPALVFTDNVDIERKAKGAGSAVISLAGETDGSVSYVSLFDGITDTTIPATPGGIYQCILYTSGTQGRPKGVVLTHQNMVMNSFFLLAHEIQVGTDDVHLISTPLFNRLGITRLVTAAGLGATCILLTKPGVEHVKNALDHQGVTFMGTVPTVLRMLERGWPEAIYPQVTCVVLAGEMISAAVLALARRLFPAARTYSIYASSEAGLIGIGRLSGDSSEGGMHPVLGVQVRVVPLSPDDSSIGELWVRSGEPGTYTSMKGYWRHDAVDEQAFDGGWLPTGDIGRLDAMGRIYVLDRAKDMIITGGVNVYSTQVENCLRQHPSVAQVAVVGVPHPVWGEAVVAAVVVRAGCAFTEVELEQYARNHLPAYAVPKAIATLDTLPVNAMGKVVKTELRNRLISILGEQS